MIPAQKPANELERLAALYQYDLLDTFSEKEYDDITNIAAEICGVPISLISLIDGERQWFKSRVGLEPQETHRDLAFCAHAILTPQEIFVVDDPANDERFHDNPLVTGAPNIAFYAGVPLVNESGNALGTICVIDDKPRQLSKEQLVALKALARQVVANFEIRRNNKLLQEQKAQLEQVNLDLTRFAHVVAHDVKSPIGSIAMCVNYLKETYADALDGSGIHFLEMMEKTSLKAIEMINGILNHTLTTNHADLEKEHMVFGMLVDELKQSLIIPDEFLIEVHYPETEVYTCKSMLLQILMNLCNNAIKYNDKESGHIVLSATDKGAFYSFSVKDNGPGISEENQVRIFELFTTLGTLDRFNNMGTGIGLSTVKRLVQKLGGTIEIKSEPGIGCEFIFTISK